MKEFCQQHVVSSPYVMFIIKSANSFKSPLAIVWFVTVIAIKNTYLAMSLIVNDSWSLFHLEGQNYLIQRQDIFVLTLEGKKKPKDFLFFSPNNTKVLMASCHFLSCVTSCPVDRGWMDWWSDKIHFLDTQLYIF